MVRKKIETRFIGVLAIISIIGFLEIVLMSLFNLNIAEYSSFFWLITMGIGFFVISRPGKLYTKVKESFTELAFYRLITLIIGAFAIIAGFLSLPQFEINHPVFLAIKGVISIIAIIFIAVQTWTMK
ncbi:MAG: hypothetical protein U9Q99_00275 [Nanoarchaeota archaeon]|nr:hypothetical protein [Nanoarchaeota archaeon]